MVLKSNRFCAVATNELTTQEIEQQEKSCQIISGLILAAIGGLFISVSNGILKNLDEKRDRGYALNALRDDLKKFEISDEQIEEIIKSDKISRSDSKYILELAVNLSDEKKNGTSKGSVLKNLRDKEGISISFKETGPSQKAVSAGFVDGQEAVKTGLSQKAASAGFGDGQEAEEAVEEVVSSLV